MATKAELEEEIKSLKATIKKMVREQEAGNGGLDLDVASVAAAMKAAPDRHRIQAPALWSLLDSAVE